MDLVQEALALLAVLLTFLLWFVYSPEFPDEVPVHYDVEGNPNGWGKPNELLVLPFVSLGLYALTTLLNFVPHTFNYPIKVTMYNAKAVYTKGTRMVRAIKTVCNVGLFVLVYAQFDGISNGNYTLSPVYLWGFLIAVGLVIIRYFIALYKLAKFSK